MKLITAQPTSTSALAFAVPTLRSVTVVKATKFRNLITGNKRLKPSAPTRADTNGETLFLITPLGGPGFDRV